MLDFVVYSKSKNLYAVKLLDWVMYSRSKTIMQLNIKCVRILQM